jgi:glycosyltransferase involved in cell wall biosynthesis
LDVFREYFKIEVKDVCGVNVATILSGCYNKYDAVFTIFGPFYNLRYSGRLICGFAQPWIIFNKNEIYNTFGCFDRVRTDLKLWLQTFFFNRADLLIVEHEHVRRKLLDNNRFMGKSIDVISNSISQIFLDSNSWVSCPTFTRVQDVIYLGFIGRNYPHKNTKVFPLVKKKLLEKYGVNVNFVVTFRDDEWNDCSQDFRLSAINIGELTASQCPSFYKMVDAVIFPSLLECFSATPIEAMYMNTPLFASDRSFIREMCFDFPIYFEPTSIESISGVIAEFAYSRNVFFNDLDKGRQMVASMSNSFRRFEEYISVINKFICNDGKSHV